MAKILWFTGLSGSGKTTLSNKIKKILEKKGKKILILDGDNIRKILHTNLKFTPKDIKKNNLLICKICLKERENYDYILVSVITPFNESRNLIKKKLKKDLIEIFIDCPLKECIKRDPKGLYKKALDKKIKNFIGISKIVPYEKPLNSDIKIRTDKENIKKSLNRILLFLKN